MVDQLADLPLLRKSLGAGLVSCCHGDQCWFFLAHSLPQIQHEYLTAKNSFWYKTQSHDPWGEYFSKAVATEITDLRSTSSGYFTRKWFTRHRVTKLIFQFDSIGPLQRKAAVTQEAADTNHVARQVFMDPIQPQCRNEQ